MISEGVMAFRKRGIARVMKCKERLTFGLVRLAFRGESVFPLLQVNIFIDVVAAGFFCAQSVDDLMF